MSLPFFTYMLRCRDGTYYVGHTDDIDKRIDEHREAKGCWYTRSRLPVQLVWFERFPTRDKAKEVEKRLKGWSQAKKEALIQGRFELLPSLSSSTSEIRNSARDTLCTPTPPSSQDGEVPT
jgi:tRNA/rRNA methyltransferase